MSPNIAFIFDHFRKNAEMIAYIKAHPELCDELIHASMLNAHDKSWRAAMLLGHFMHKYDTRVQPFVQDFIDFLPRTKSDGHQRQILVILEMLQLNDDHKGHLFNHCLSIWEEVNKIPSTRYRAFIAMLTISKDYPELKEELKHFVTPYYLQTLSPGVVHALKKRIKNQLG